MISSVYFAEIKAGPIKIGWTGQEPSFRIAELQTGCPWEICLIGFVPGESRHERALHAKFDADRMFGEWFQRSAVLETEIAKILRPDFIWDIIWDISNNRPSASLIDSFGGAAEFGRVIGVPAIHAQTMKNRNSIPAGYWLRTVEAAQELCIEGVTLELLANLANSKRPARAAQ